MPAGRKTKYEPARVKKILDAIRVGATYTHACNYAGISFETFSQWQQKYPEFSEQVKEAEGAALVGWLAKIEAAANDGNWQAAAWKAERRYPEDYGRRVQDTRHSGATTVMLKPVDYRAGLEALKPDDADA